MVTHRMRKPLEKVTRWMLYRKKLVAFESNLVNQVLWGRRRVTTERESWPIEIMVVGKVYTADGCSILEVWRVEYGETSR